ncbi:hypothetical protein MY3296_000600 [Beauveria thailandica]
MPINNSLEVTIPPFKKALVKTTNSISY